MSSEPITFPIICKEVFSLVDLVVVERVMRTATIERVNMRLGDFLYGAYTPLSIREQLTALASKATGRKLISALSFIRLNHSGTDKSIRIHADSAAMGDIDVASVFYLDSNAEHGTALFRHPDIGPRCKKGGQPVYKSAEGWEKYFFYPAERNTMLMYSADMFHCRWPVISYGSSIEDGRLIIVNFMRYAK